MTEGWMDCPSLGPGWQRREVLRKHGTRPGHTDTYYMSPRGEKIRSRVELTKLLGCSRDLRDFDFKKGIFLDPGVEPEVKKHRKRHPLPPAADPLEPENPPDLEESEKPPDLDLPDQKPLKLELELPMEEEEVEAAPLSVVTSQLELPAPTDQLAPKQRKRRRQNHHLPILAPGNGGEVAVEGTSPEETVACCASCQVQFPGVMLPTQRRCRWLCPDCRDQRRDFNREQRYYKQIGCGVCQACQMSQDCGICSVCVLRAKSPALRIGIKCLLRRCLRIVIKGPECGLCQACKITEDCGSCVICLRRQTPGMKRQWKCLKRRCLKRKKKMPSKKDSCSSKKLIIEAASAKDALAPTQRRQKKPVPATDGPLPKAQRGPRPRQRHRQLSAPSPPVANDGPLPKVQPVSSCHRHRDSSTARWKPTMAWDPGSVPVAKNRNLLSIYTDDSGIPLNKKKQLGTVKERKKVGHPPQHPTGKLKKSMHASKSRQNRKCGECEACLLKTDCGRCDFCCDKPKFGGQNMKRQKCRWRQCLQFAMKRLLPEEWSSPEVEGAAVAGWKARRRRRRRRRTAFGVCSRSPARIKQVGQQGPKGSGQKRLAKARFQPEEPSSSSESVDPPKSHSQEKSKQHLPPPLLLSPLELQNKAEGSGITLAQGPMKERPIPVSHAKQEPEVHCHPTPPSRVLVKGSGTRLPAVNLIATSPKMKQEHAETGGDRRPSSDSTVSAGLPQFKRSQGTQHDGDVVVLDDEEDDEVEQLQQIRPPMIMEILSLSGMQPLTQLDNVLREFLEELNEIPLPAHWEMLPPGGSPNLRLVQRSKHSTMSAAVIHIHPGLYFHVMVRDLPVPPEHELYASHPARLTTVDEVVELIGDLEAYRLCSGWPAGWHAGERSEACDVLVYSGCCLQCRLNPWPSGSGAQ